MAGGPAAGESYSGTMGFVYVFNLVVGFGALTLPEVFFNAGWALGSGFLTVLAFMSLVTATFVVESMSVANAVVFLDLRKQDGKYRALDTTDAENEDGALELPRQRSDRNENRVVRRSTMESEDEDEDEQHDREIAERLTQEPFELRQKVELGRMARLFLGERGFRVLMAVTGVYLYGDLSIYASATPTALVSLFPGEMESIEVPWIGEVRLDNGMAYNVWLALFATVVVPLSCLNFQKTKHLQIFTCTYRNMAVLSMIVLATIRFSQHAGREDLPAADLPPPAGGLSVVGGRRVDDVPVAELGVLPKLFGAATYSFMCHHSIPSIVFPIEGKARQSVQYILAADYAAILVVYLVLCITAVLSFGMWRDDVCDIKPKGPTCGIQEIYILNFNTAANPFFGDFLALLPVFVCFTNYPLIAITTRNNLCEWFDVGLHVATCRVNGLRRRRTTSDGIEGAAASGGGGGGSSNNSASGGALPPVPLTRKDSEDHRDNKSPPLPDSPGPPVPKLWHSLLVAVPPILIAFGVHDVSVIVEFTGSYAGLALEFLFPVWLVVAARRRLVGAVDPKLVARNPYRSPFQGRLWTAAVLFWALFSLAFILLSQLSSAEIGSVPRNATRLVPGPP